MARPPTAPPERMQLLRFVARIQFQTFRRLRIQVSGTGRALIECILTLVPGKLMAYLLAFTNHDSSL